MRSFARVRALVALDVARLDVARLGIRAPSSFFGSLSPLAADDATTTADRPRARLTRALASRAGRVGIVTARAVAPAPVLALEIIGIIEHRATPRDARGVARAREATAVPCMFVARIVA